MFSSNTSRVSADANYIEDVFSTYLYTGNSSTQTITNGIDLAGKGGLVWTKARTANTFVVGNNLIDTERGNTVYISSNSTAANANAGTFSFLGNGFSIGTSGSLGGSNYSTENYASWTFRKQAKFFDIVTYTGNGSYPRSISHNLGSTPGCIIIKRTSGLQSWVVWHRAFSNTTTDYLILNATDAVASNANTWGSMTSTTFGVNSYSGANVNGETYVAYLFAHDAGGFGPTGSDNVISCGSYTDNGTDQVISLGYEPQWILVKDSANAGTNWFLIDTMRGWLGQPVSATASVLQANLSNAEVANGAWLNVTPTGFQIKSGSGLGNSTFIYIAIRRGPMKVPTSGTSVFSPNVVASDLNGATTGFPVDMLFELTTGVDSKYSFSRLTGTDFFRTSATTAGSGADANWYRSNTGIGSGGTGVTGAAAVYESFRRAPGYFDVVVYTGTGANRTVTHNLGAVPELMLIRRTTTSDWWVYDAATGNTKYQILNLQDAPATSTAAWNNTTPTSSVFTVGTGLPVNASGVTCMAYLFATCPGVSKVGSYTGSGTTKQIDCGFTNGARFVLIKRTDSTGDWYVWDTARGIVSGNDPYLLLNSTAAEVTSTDYIDTYSAGFELSSTAPAALNANGGSYIFLAIA